MLAKSGLSKADLGRLWTLADADRDGKLSRPEFAVAMHLAASAAGKAALPLPEVLPPCLAAAAAAAAAEAAPASAATPQGRPGDVQAVEGRVVLVDDAASVVSSLGYPAGLSDAEGSDRICNSSGGADSARDDKDAAAVLGGKTGTAEEIIGGPAGKETSKGKGQGRGKGGEGEVSGAGKGKEMNLRYDMSDQDTARYGQTFDKLMKGKGTTHLGGKEVCHKGGRAFRARLPQSRAAYKRN